MTTSTVAGDDITDHCPPPNREAAQHLRDGLEKLREHGWGRGKFHNHESGQFDMLGALGAPFAPNNWPEAAEYLAYAIRARPEADRKNMRDLSTQMVILRFNDGFRRTWAEVEAVYLAAIACAEG